MKKISSIILIFFIGLLVIGVYFLYKNNSQVNEPNTQSIKLYYYNPENDGGPGGVMCSDKGLVEVFRKVPITQTPLRDSVELLLRGELTEEEKKSGVTTEFPLGGLTLKSANIKDGIAILEFSDPNNKTVGGSCRVSILWAQIRNTAMQFEGVKEVRFLPEDLFQP